MEYNTISSRCIINSVRRFVGGVWVWEYSCVLIAECKGTTGESSIGLPFFVVLSSDKCTFYSRWIDRDPYISAKRFFVDTHNSILLRTQNTTKKKQTAFPVLSLCAIIGMAAATATNGWIKYTNFDVLLRSSKFIGFLHERRCAPFIT